LTREPQLVRAIGETFTALHSDEMKIVQQSTMDNLLAQITATATGVKIAVAVTKRSGGASRTRLPVCPYRR
jgi:hypothetical protein